MRDAAGEARFPAGLPVQVLDGLAGDDAAVGVREHEDAVAGGREPEDPGADLLDVLGEVAQVVVVFGTDREEVDGVGGVGRRGLQEVDDLAEAAGAVPGSWDEKDGG